MALVILALLIAYLIGAIPFGYLIARWRGVDILHQGSGNIGATNVGRILGKRFGILVFCFDFAKGAVPVAVAGALPVPAELPPNALPVAAGLCAFLGHLFPIYLRFRGGKGVATGAGVVVVLLPAPAVVGVLVWLSVLAATRYVSLASITAALALCAVRLLGTTLPFSPVNHILTWFCLLAAALVVARHGKNLARLLQGTENRFPDTPAMMRISRMLHVLTMGLWFGTVVFFMLVAVLLFHTFEAPAAKPPEDRPDWTRLIDNYDKQKGTRLAGTAVGPLFDWYFPLQGLCGLVALVPAMTWAGTPGGGVDRFRFVILALAFLSVLVGYPLAGYVSELRIERYSADPVIRDRAVAAFATWHLVSLLLNFVTLLLVTPGMALAAFLPQREPVAERPAPANYPVDPLATTPGHPITPVETRIPGPPA